MESSGGDNTSTLQFLVEEAAVAVQSSSSITSAPPSTLDSDHLSEEALFEKFENVGLEPNEDEDDVDGDQSDQGGAREVSKLHPLRPHAEDCPYYLRTGTCKFGLNCRYNHPVRRLNQKIGREKEKEKDKEKDKPTAVGGIPEKPYKIECKYYRSAEGCKYGTSCRFRHSKDESEIVHPELNFLGLPIRPGEKECPFYMRTGSCGYGARCNFNHPDPMAVGEYESHNLTPNNESVMQFGLPSGEYYDESISMHQLGALQQVQASSSLQTPSDQNVPYQKDNYSAYLATMQFPQGALQSEWDGYQVPDSAEEMARYPHFAPAARSLTKRADMPNQFEEFPERPGQPECAYFMKTGNCKFKSACRYHHPRSPAYKLDCCLSDKGLPLRPGRKICRNYEQFGICKYGRACLFDHPVDLSSDFTVGPVSES